MNQSQAIPAFWGNVIGATLLVYMIFPVADAFYALIWLAAQITTVGPPSRQLLGNCSATAPALPYHLYPYRRPALPSDRKSTRLNSSHQ